MDMHTVVVGTSGTTAEDVLAVARGGARVELSDGGARGRSPRAREIVDALAAKPEPVYGVSTGFGALAVRHISPELRAQLQRNIVRSHAAGMGPRVEREVVRALMFLRLKTVCLGPHRRTARGRADHGRRAQRRHHPRRPRVRLPRLLRRPRAALPLRADADGRGRRGGPRRHRAARRRTARRARHRARRTAREGGPRPPQRHRRHARHAGHGLRRPRRGLHLRRHHRRALPGGAARHRQGPRPRAARHPPAPRARPPRAANMLPVLAGSGLTGHHQDDAPARPGRLLGALRPAGRRRRPGHPRRTPALVADRELASAVDNPVVLPDGRVESNGNFHGAPGRLRPGLPRHRRRRPRLDRRAPHRPAARQEPLARPAAVPGRRRRRRLRPDDRPVHAGRAGQRDEAARRARPRRTRSRPPRCRRTTSRWAGRRRASCAPRSTT